MRSSQIGDLDATVVEQLRHETGVDELEAFVKRGRSRRLLIERERETHSEAEERGWAVRAVGRRGSFFACGTGALESSLEWPEPEGRPIQLPEPESPAEVEGPVELEGSDRTSRPVASESELRRLAGELAGELERAAPSARIDRLELEDGESESRIGSSKGVLAGARTRLATASLELVGLAAHRPGAGLARVRAERLLPDLRSLAAWGIAERLAALLTVETSGEPVDVESCDVVAAPEIVTALLAGLLPLFVDPRAEELADGMAAGGDLGSPALTLVDDGRLPGGVLAAPVDGEGTPTRPVVLVEAGAFRQQLLPWWRRRSGCVSGGCSRRESWRDPPRVGPSHFYLRPDPGTAPSDLVESLVSGYHLLDATGPPRIDLAGDSFVVPVRGFEVHGGDLHRPVAHVELAGGVSDLLRGVRSVARDLTFLRHPVGVLGSPTALISGLTLRTAA